MLTSCGKTVGVDEDVHEQPPVTVASTTQTTSAVTTAVTTTAAKKASKKIPDEVYFETIGDIEVYKVVTVGELIADTNAEITNPETKLTVRKLGENTVNVEFNYEGEPYEKEVKYNVVDTTDPLPLNMGWNPYVKVNTPFNLNSVIGYADNYDRSPVATYTGEVDTSQIGSYPITVTVTDSSGNSTSWDMTVFVLSEIPAPEDNNRRITFEEFMDNYNYENVSYGIDVSAWQTNVDYEKVKEQGCEFVLMRMGYSYGQIKEDDYYRKNIENATAAGLDVGVYFYTTANSEEEAREQARWIVEQLDGRELDYPIAFDWEEWAQFQQYGMSIRDLNNVFEAFCKELEKYGYTGMLYSSKNFLVNVWENRNNRTVWLAHYTDETDYDGQFAIWQASAYGRMDGIVGDVDLNIRVNEVSLY